MSITPIMTTGDAAVDADILAGDIAGAVGEQERRRPWRSRLTRPIRFIGTLSAVSGLRFRLSI